MMQHFFISSILSTIYTKIAFKPWIPTHSDHFLVKTGDNDPKKILLQQEIMKQDFWDSLF